MTDADLKKKTHVTKDDIKAGLSRLGLKKGDNAGVHSSLSSFGYVEGGAETVIDAILETVAPGGTVVMPTYSKNTRRLELAAEDREAGITSKIEYLPYEPDKTPCWTGKIADTFWRRKEAFRGYNENHFNPGHSLSAIGPRAEFLASGGGWENLLNSDGYILLIGVTLYCCSSMHLAEKGIEKPKSPPLPEKLRERLDWHNRNSKIGGIGGIRLGYSYPGQLCYPDFKHLEEPCMERGIMKAENVGNSTLKLVKLSELLDLYRAYLEKEPHLFFHE